MTRACVSILSLVCGTDCRWLAVSHAVGFSRALVIFVVHRRRETIAHAIVCRLGEPPSTPHQPQSSNAVLLDFPPAVHNSAIKPKHTELGQDCRILQSGSAHSVLRCAGHAKFAGPGLCLGKRDFCVDILLPIPTHVWHMTGMATSYQRLLV